MKTCGICGKEVNLERGTTVIGGKKFPVHITCYLGETLCVDFVLPELYYAHLEINRLMRILYTTQKTLEELNEVFSKSALIFPNFENY